MDKTRKFAILAPVPEMHLHSGLESLNQQLDQDIVPPFVAYGSMAFERFNEIEELREGKSVEVFIYASHCEGDRPLNSEVTWKGLYIGLEKASGGGRYRGRVIHRPKSTASDRGPWGIFWRLTQLEKFQMGLPIGKLQGLKAKKLYQDRFIPEGPLIITYPHNQSVFLKK